MISDEDEDPLWGAPPFCSTYFQMNGRGGFLLPKKGCITLLATNTMGAVGPITCKCGRGPSKKRESMYMSIRLEHYHSQKKKFDWQKTH